MTPFTSTPAIERPAGPPAWPTLCACILVLAALAWAVHGLTRGFESWTFEALRADAAARGALRAPSVEIATSAGERLRPWSVPGRDARRQVYVVDFVYTRCPTVCRALGAPYAQMQALVRASAPGTPRPRLLSLSFDPEHDDLAALGRWARAQRADASIWTVATPATAAQRDALLRALGVVVVPDGFGGFVHNDAIAVIDGAGIVRSLFDASRWPQALAAAQAAAASP